MVRLIKFFHDCDASHVESVPLRKAVGRKMAWDGVVEVFTLSGHPRATRAFAWHYREDGKTTTAVVLDLPPIKSPETAVKMEVLVKEMLAWRRHGKHDTDVTTTEEESVFDLSWEKLKEMTAADLREFTTSCEKMPRKMTDPEMREFIISGEKAIQMTDAELEESQRQYKPGSPILRAYQGEMLQRFLRRRRSIKDDSKRCAIWIVSAPFWLLFVAWVLFVVWLFLIK
jgi:hypothetical protein